MEEGFQQVYLASLPIGNGAEAMSELDLLNLARSATANEVSWFSQMTTITFAMVVAIYYFLSGASRPLKIFSFTAYMIGMVTFLGEMLIESNVKVAALAALRVMPAAKGNGPIAQYVQVMDSWLGLTTTVFFNLSFWVLWVGIFFLLFHWKGGHKSGEKPA
jgi:hypothetical protein